MAGDKKSKIDSLLVNATWLEGFADVETTFHPPGISNHSSLIMTVMLIAHRMKPSISFNHKIEHGRFTCHPWSAEVKISYQVFADDLFIHF